MNENKKEIIWIPQSGFIPTEPKPSDYMIGGVTGVPLRSTRNVLGDWTMYQPAFLPQFLEGQFDTFACTTFSAISCIEIQLNYLLANNFLSKNTTDFLQNNSYIGTDKKIHISRRFTAITSGTTKDGNTFPRVWDAIRRDFGLLPEVDLPFTGKTFEEYYNPPLKITNGMYNKAKQFLSYFDVKYEWMIINTGDGMIDTLQEETTLEEAKQQAPLQIAIPNPAHHATVLASDTEIFDTYPPYLFTFSDSYPVQYVMRGFISEKVPIIAYSFRNALSLGSISNDVLMLQKFLNTTDTPIGNYGKETTYFGTATQAALALFQKKWSISPSIGYFGPMTMAKVNGLCVTPIYLASKLDKWALAIQQHEGYYPGSTSYTNNNPGNIRYLGQTLAIGHDARNFCIFKTYADGYTTLKNMLANAATGKSSVYSPEDTLISFYAKYAPGSDGNDSMHYAQVVADAIGVTPDTKIKMLV